MPRYELVAGKSDKFWEIALAGSSFTTTYGRRGATGQSTTKRFASPQEAKAAYDKAVAQKLGKGYKLVPTGKRTVSLAKAGARPGRRPAASVDRRAAAEPTLSPALIKQIERLGGKINRKATIPTEVPTHVGDKRIAPALARFAYGVTWPVQARYCARTETSPQGLVFSTSEFTEEGDFYDGVGVIKLGYDSDGYEYLARVGDRATTSDPAFYRVDHAGPYELDRPQRLSDFLASLISETQETTVDSVIPDQKLALAVYKSLGSRKKVDAAELARVRSLIIENEGIEGIKSLRGLERCVALRVLELNFYSPIDLGPVLKLVNLEELGLPYRFTDIQAIRPLVKLRRLRLNTAAAGALDLRAITGLTQLEELDAGKVSSLEPLTALVNLKKLTLGDCETGGLEPLAKLSQLTYLKIGSLPSTDLSPLSGLTALEEVELFLGKVSTLEPLVGLPRLKYVNVWRFDPKTPANQKAIATFLKRRVKVHHI